jgi:hypothetical protein
MTPEEARTFLRHIKGDRLEALYVIALSLGLRVSELLALAVGTTSISTRLAGLHRRSPFGAD